MKKVQLVFLMTAWAVFSTSCVRVTSFRPEQKIDPALIRSDRFENFWFDFSQCTSHTLECKQAFTTLIRNVTPFKKQRSIYAKIPHYNNWGISWVKSHGFTAYRIDNNESVWILRNGRDIPDQSNMLAGCGVALFNTDGQLLLVRNRGVSFWHFPGGANDKQELILDCAVREIKEELSVNIQNSKLKTIALYNKIGQMSELAINSLGIYFIYSQAISTEITVDRNEIEEITWIDPNELQESTRINNYPLSPFVAQFHHQLDSRTSKNEFVRVSPTHIIQTFRW